MSNTSNSSVNLLSLDFAGIKESLKTHLKNQAAFQDYDFEGSNMSVLLDVLAYNTFLNNFYVNMDISESFLDSAQLRESVLSRSKELNYVPRSARSSKANITVTFEATGESNPYTIPKGSSFTTVIKNDSFVFTIPETLICASSNNSFTFETDIYEGVYIKDSYIFDSTLEVPRYRITNKNIDTTSITVVVYEDGQVVGDNYTLASSMLGLTERSKVFFLQTSENGFYEIVFGDNVVGRRPKHNSTILIDYRITEGSKSNGSREFSINFDPTGASELLATPEIVVNSSAQNGAEEESTESIRYYAPRHFQIQERTVTTTDYEIALKTQFPEINAVSVYGGEELEPPTYGKVYVAVDISGIDSFPDSKKQEYYSFIKSRAPLSIDPVFIDPEYLYLDIDSTVRYNLNTTKSSRDRIKTVVTDAINQYVEDNLNSFSSTLRYSNLLSLIDDSESSIISNVTDVKIYKKVVPELNKAQNIDLKFNMALRNEIPYHGDVHRAVDVHTITSSLFTYNGEQCTVEDSGDGTLAIMKTTGNFGVKIVDVGTVDYDTGVVKLINFNISGYQGDSLKIYAIPRDKDISSTKNTILTLEPSNLIVSIEAIRE